MNLLPTSNPEWEVPKSENKRKKKTPYFFISLLQIMVNPFFFFFFCYNSLHYSSSSKVHGKYEPGKVALKPGLKSYFKVKIL